MAEWTRIDVALVQAASGLDPRANTARIDSLTPADVDLVVLPEVFQRDFGPVGDDLVTYAEGLDGPFARELARVATTRKATVIAGMVEEHHPTPYNTLVAAHPEPGRQDSYRKIHLYDSFGYRESDRLSAGPLAPVVFDLGGFGVGLMTCYDLRFPELARALVDAGAEVLVLPAAWVAGERKRDHWRTLVHARAIENTVYVVAVGQPEPRYTGHSTVVSPMGDVLVELGCGEGNVATLLDRDQVVRARKVNPSLANRRG